MQIGFIDKIRNRRKGHFEIPFPDLSIENPPIQRSLSYIQSHLPPLVDDPDGFHFVGLGRGPDKLESKSFRHPRFPQKPAGLFTGRINVLGKTGNLDEL